jgi:hypothetical protein
MEYYRVLGFIRFNDYETFSDDYKVKDTVLWEMFHKSVATGVNKNINSVGVLLETILQEGLKLNVVEKYSETFNNPSDETVIFFMGRVYNVYKVLTYLYYIETVVNNMSFVFDIQLSEPERFVGETGEYRLTYPKTIKSRFSLSLPHTHIEDDFVPFFVSNIMRNVEYNEKNLKLFKQFIVNVPEYVENLLMFSYPDYCYNMFKDVKNIVLTVDK